MSKLGDLDDYLFGALPEEQVDAFEQALFDSAARGDNAESQFLDRVGVWGRFLAARSGLIDNFTRAFVDSLVERGFKVEIEEAKPGQPFSPQWSEEAEIAVTRYAFDVRGHTGRLEADVETPEGDRVKTFRDVLYDPTDGAIYAVCEALLARKTVGLHCLIKLYEWEGNERRHLGTIEQLPR